MSMKCSQTPASPRIPQFYIMILRPRDKQAFRGMPVYSLGVPTVARKQGFFDTCSEIEYLERLVIGCGHEFAVIR